MPAIGRVVRDGAARGRRPLLRVARHEGLRRGVRAGRARDEAHRLPSPSRARCSARGRTSPRRSSRSSASAPGVPPGVKRVVEGAFAHRRKTLANSLALAGVASRERRRPRARGDRPRPGRPRRGARRRPSSSRSRTRCRDHARRAREDQPRARRRRARRRRATTRWRPCSSGIDLVRHDLARAGRRARRRGLRRGHDRPARAREPRGGGRRRAALARADREADPGRRRPRRRQLRRRDGAPARERDARRAASAAASFTRSRGSLGADVPFFLEPGPQLGTGDGSTLAAARGCRRTTPCCSLLPHGAREGVDRPPSTAASRRAPASTERRARVLDDRRGRAPSRATSPRFRRTTSPPRRSRPSCVAAAPSAPTSAAPARPSTASSPTDAAAAARRGRRRPPSAGPGSPSLPGSVFSDGDSGAVSGPGGFLAERRLRIALGVAVVEGVLVVVGRDPGVGGLRRRRSARSAYWCHVGRNVRLADGAPGAAGSSPRRRSSCCSFRCSSSSSRRVAYVALAILAVAALFFLFTERERKTPGSRADAIRFARRRRLRLR